MCTYNRCPLAFVMPIHIIMRLHCIVAVKLSIHQFIAAQKKLSTYRFFSFFNISYICKHLKKNLNHCYRLDTVPNQICVFFKNYLDQQYTQQIQVFSFTVITHTINEETVQIIKSFVYKLFLRQL